MRITSGTPISDRKSVSTLYMLWWKRMQNRNGCKKKKRPYRKFSVCRMVLPNVILRAVVQMVRWIRSQWMFAYFFRLNWSPNISTELFIRQFVLEIGSASISDHRYCCSSSPHSIVPAFSSHSSHAVALQLSFLIHIQFSWNIANETHWPFSESEHFTQLLKHTIWQIQFLCAFKPMKNGGAISLIYWNCKIRVCSSCDSIEKNIEWKMKQQHNHMHMLPIVSLVKYYN